MINDLRIKRVEENKMENYTVLKDGERFLYTQGIFEFFGFKYNDEFAILVNGCGQFIVAKAYKNCLSIGSEFVKEFATITEAEEQIAEGKFAYL